MKHFINGKKLIYFVVAAIFLLFFPPICRSQVNASFRYSALFHNKTVANIMDTLNPLITDSSKNPLSTDSLVLVNSLSGQQTLWPLFKRLYIRAAFKPLIIDSILTISVNDTINKKTKLYADSVNKAAKKWNLDSIRQMLIRLRADSTPAILPSKFTDSIASKDTKMYSDSIAKIMSYAYANSTTPDDVKKYTDTVKKIILQMDTNSHIQNEIKLYSDSITKKFALLENDNISQSTVKIYVDSMAKRVITAYKDGITIAEKTKATDTTIDAANKGYQYKFRPQYRKAYEKYFIDSLNAYLYNSYSTSAFENISSQLGNNSFIGAEFASFYLGIIRMGVSGYFQATGDTAKDNVTKGDLQKMLQNGGNLAINFNVPFLFVRSENERYHFAVTLFSSFAFSSSSKSFLDSTIGFTGQSGITFHSDFTSNNSSNKAKLSFELPISYFYGGKTILQNMGLPDFSMIQFKASITLNELLTFSLRYPIVSTSSIINNNFRQLTGGVSFSPTQILKSTTK